MSSRVVVLYSRPAVEGNQQDGLAIKRFFPNYFHVSGGVPRQKDGGTIQVYSIAPKPPNPSRKIVDCSANPEERWWQGPETFLPD